MKLELEEIKKFRDFDREYFRKISKNKIKINVGNVKEKILDIKLKKNEINYIEINIDKNINVNLFDFSKCDGDYIKIVEINVDENSIVNYRSLQNDGNVKYFCRKYGNVKNNSELNWIGCFIGSGTGIEETKTFLAGENSGSNNYSVIFGNNEQKFEINNVMIHERSNTYSDMRSNIILNDKAFVRNSGLIKIKENSVNCKGYQKSDTILLSEDAKSIIIPNLEIKNDEVKCSHGATISQINDEDLFYLMSRGLSEEEAKRTIISGFFEPILVMIKDNKIKEEINHAIINKI